MHQIKDEKGSVLVMAMILMLLLILLGFGLISMSETEVVIALNDQLSEGAFQAAEAAAQEGVGRINVNSTNVVVAETGIGEWYRFRSGRREDSEPQPPQFVGNAEAPGYAVGTGTGYNGSNYDFRVYSVSGTGTGPRQTEREVEVRVLLGPFESGGGS